MAEDPGLNPSQYTYSRLSRCSTTRGSNTGLFRVDPTKVKARKSFLFTEGSLKFVIINEI